MARKNLSLRSNSQGHWVSTLLIASLSLLGAFVFLSVLHSGPPNDANISPTMIPTWTVRPLPTFVPRQGFVTPTPTPAPYMGRIAYRTNSSLWTVDLATQHRRLLVQDLNMLTPNIVPNSPGDWLAYNDTNGILHVVRTSDSWKLQICSSPANLISWAPDGKSLAYSTIPLSGTAQLYVTRVTGEIIVGPLPASTPVAWSTDNRYFALGEQIYNRPEGTLIYPSSASGSDHATLLNWSPDGTLAIYREYNGLFMLAEFLPDGRHTLIKEFGQRNTPNGFYYAQEWIWSPDGQAAVFVYQPATTHYAPNIAPPPNLAIIIDRSGKEQGMPWNSVGRPVWRENNQALVALYDGSPELKIVDTRGQLYAKFNLPPSLTGNPTTGLTPIATTQPGNFCPGCQPDLQWSPDGKSLSFVIRSNAGTQIPATTPSATSGASYFFLFNIGTVEAAYRITPTEPQPVKEKWHMGCLLLDQSNGAMTMIDTDKANTLIGIGLGNDGVWLGD